MLIALEALADASAVRYLPRAHSMKLQGLILLVLMIVGGTAATVRWYLQAESRGAARNVPVQTVARPASSPQSTGLPMRADPARHPAYEPLSSTWEGVASRDSKACRDSKPGRLEGSPELAPPACGEGAAALAAFAPADPL